MRQLFTSDPRRGERLSVETFANRVRSGAWLESSTEPKLKHDSSTNAPIRRYRKMTRE